MDYIHYQLNKINAPQSGTCANKEQSIGHSDDPDPVQSPKLWLLLHHHYSQRQSFFFCWQTLKLDPLSDCAFERYRLQFNSVKVL